MRLEEHGEYNVQYYHVLFSLPFNYIPLFCIQSYFLSCCPCYWLQHWDSATEMVILSLNIGVRVNSSWWRKPKKTRVWLKLVRLNPRNLWIYSIECRIQYLNLDEALTFEGAFLGSRSGLPAKPRSPPQLSFPPAHQPTTTSHPP